MKDIGTCFPSSCLFQEIAVLFNVEHHYGKVGFFVREYPTNLRLCPHIELSFHTLTIRILSRVKSPRRCGHIPQDVSKDFPCSRFIFFFARCLIGFHVRNRKHGLVVEHLFKMGH